MYAYKRNINIDTRGLLIGQEILFMQKVFKEDEEKEFWKILNEKSSHLFVVCGESCKKLDIIKNLSLIDAQITFFSDFEPNPVYESVVLGVEKFNRNNCNAILAVGGGSAIDVAKCIKLFVPMDRHKDYLMQMRESNNIKNDKSNKIYNNIDLFAIPTTAGTGSEATKFAVIYKEGIKQSISHASLISSYVLLYSPVLEVLPEYQRKVTMLDALCHGIESFWSVNSTDESRAFSAKAIKIIVANIEDYLSNTKSGNRNMLEAAHIAGQAINIAKTTAAHAMSYKLTSLYKIAHGHAVAVCLPTVWKYMLENSDKCVDKRRESFVKEIFVKIANSMNCADCNMAINFLEQLLNRLQLKGPVIIEQDLEKLVYSVNSDRLNNNPVKLQDYDIREIYTRI